MTAAVVTGGGGAIGHAIAVGLAERGHRLILPIRSRESAAALLNRFPGRAVEVDLASIGEVEALCAELAKLERVEVIVHAAGALRLGRVESFDLDELDVLYHVNLRAAARITQALLPAVRAAQGQVVFVNSSAAAGPGRPGSGGYDATKHALRAFADALRAEENEHGLRVLSVYPGRTAGPMQERLHAREGRAYEPSHLLQPEDVAAAVLSALDLPRTGEVTDVHIRPRQKPLQ